MIKFKINDNEVKAREGWTVLETAKEYGIDIPTLCHHPAVTPTGSCRLCMVELREGDWSKLVASCIYPVKEGITIYTETPKVHNVRRWILNTGLPSSTFNTRWVSACLSAGGIIDYVERLTNALSIPLAFLAQACQHLWPVQHNDV